MAEKKKILYIVEAMGGGVFTYIVELANELVNKYDMYIAYSVTITNEKEGEVDTGVVLNNMPYILVLAVLAAGVAVFIIRKRRED